MTATSDRRGEISTDPDGRRRLVFRRSWPDPAADVWAALTEPERSERWIGRYGGERAPGAEGPFTMTAEEGAPVGRVRIEECAPPHRLVLRFLDEMAWRLELDLVEADGTTTLTFTQVLADDTGLSDIATGWHWYLDRLDAVLAGAPLPPGWDEFQAAVGPGYTAAVD
ncbi:SRPBCC domain-containing protein [Blastococcus sp. TF02A-26]|uniref:SRPBCC domain-containing protein n=1 Tax=Blastococcus sp. TF02A-26 TaxID=2250577 RepID=UPI000DEB0D71|nr:SRPBCC domain-containing protein [Blastococcus sp. TF02A-26]RBY82804.1 ATPase [Blastococcus sp. TF02A-26]